MPRFLHVGCGEKRKSRTVQPFTTDEWEEVTLDINEAVKPDIVDKLPELAKVQSGSFDAIYSSHNIEHLYVHEVPLAMQAFCRALNDDGFAIITCPDLQAVGERLASGDLETPLYKSPAGPVTPLDLLYGFGRSIARGHVYMAHHGGFTLKSLTTACRKGGFSTVAGFRRPHRYDLWVIASKRARSTSEISELRQRFIVPV